VGLSPDRTRSRSGALPQRAVITGASGFVGGHLAEHLRASGDLVLGCSPDGQWIEACKPPIAGQIELVPFDVGAPDGLPPETRRTLERFRPTCIYHLAALSVPEDCGESQPTALATAINVDGTARVLGLAAALPSKPRVLFISTSHVYAPLRPEAPRLDENAPLGPRRGYGRSKLAAEEEVRRAIGQHGCDALIARAFQHTGPRQGKRMMLLQWAEQFLENAAGPVEIYTRDAHIDLTDVRDIVRAYRLLMLRGRSGEVYNVGSGLVRSSGQIFAMLHQLADPRREIVEIHPGFKQDPIADISRLFAATGWQPRIPIQQTVADTWAWRLGNQVRGDRAGPTGETPDRGAGTFRFKKSA
jgi:GDP-4-dehydro-6-deoxy-D-mannose reductase